MKGSSRKEPFSLPAERCRNQARTDRRVSLTWKIQPPFGTILSRFAFFYEAIARRFTTAPVADSQRLRPLSPLFKTSARADSQRRWLALMPTDALGDHEPAHILL